LTLAPLGFRLGSLPELRQEAAAFEEEALDIEVAVVLEFEVPGGAEGVTLVADRADVARLAYVLAPARRHGGPAAAARRAPEHVAIAAAHPHRQLLAGVALEPPAFEYPTTAFH